MFLFEGIPLSLHGDGVPVVNVGSAHTRGVECISWRSLLVDTAICLYLQNWHVHVHCMNIFAQTPISAMYWPQAYDSRFVNFIVTLVWGHIVSKPRTVLDFWKAMTWSLRILWEGSYQICSNFISYVFVRVCNCYCLWEFVDRIALLSFHDCTLGFSELAYKNSLYIET